MVSHDEIAKLAHELYEKSGRKPGRDTENWHEAERMLRERHGNGGNGEKTIAAEKASSRKRTTASEGVKKSEPKKTTARKTTRKKAEA